MAHGLQLAHGPKDVLFVETDEAVAGADARQITQGLVFDRQRSKAFVVAHLDLLGGRQQHLLDQVDGGALATQVYLDDNNVVFNRLSLVRSK